MTWRAAGPFGTRKSGKSVLKDRRGDLMKAKLRPNEIEAVEWLDNRNLSERNES